ncbi:UNVERIFIED_CONTAM: hypothetical protein Cloal_3279 [Acetivibrio alkalicellulosi]
MKWLKFAKYQIAEILPSVRNFYLIFLAIIIFITIISRSNSNFSGIDFASVVFIFIAGLNSFRSSFNFALANNISRKVFLKGMIVAIFPITITMSLIDLIINRVSNIFVPNPNNFDMIYGAYRDIDKRNIIRSLDWMPQNDVTTLLGTILWQFALYSTVFLLGVLITLIYYRISKPFKILVSVSPVILIVLNISIKGMLPESFGKGLSNFAVAAFGFETQNPFIAVLSFGVIGLVFSTFIYLLTRRAVIKE